MTTVFHTGRASTALEFLWRTTGDALVLCNAQAEIIDANAAYATLTGNAPDALRQTSLLDALSGNAFSAEAHQQWLRDFDRAFSARDTGDLRRLFTAFFTAVFGMESSVILNIFFFDDASSSAGFTQSAESAESTQSVELDAVSGSALFMLSGISSRPRQRLTGADTAFEEDMQVLLLEQKRLEKSLLESQEILRANEHLLQTMMEQFPDGAVNLIDRVFTIVFTDGQDYKKFGLNAADFIGKPIDVLFPGNKAEKAKEIYRRAFEGERQTFEFEFGADRYEQIVVPLYEPDGRIERLFAVSRNITEQVRTAEALRRSEEQLRTVNALVPGVVYQYSINLESLENWYTYLSPHCKTLFGWTSDELCADITKFALLIVEPSIPDITERIKLSARERSHFLLEFRIQTPDGAEKWIEAQSLPMDSGIADVVTFNGVYLDITERKRLEFELHDLNQSLESQVWQRTEELRQSQALYKTIARNYPNGTINVFDQSNRYVFTDGTEFERIGVAPESLIGKTVEEIFPPEAAARFLEGFAAARRGQQVIIEINFPTGDYECVFVLIESEERLPQVLVVSQNVTARNAAARALIANEARHRLVLEQTGQLVYDLDIETGVNLWSGAIEKLTGYSPEEFENISVTAWADLIHPDDRDEAVRQLDATMQLGTPYNIIYRFRRKDGTYFFTEDNGVYLRGANGKAYRMLGTMQDVTERLQASEALRQSEERLRLVSQASTDAVYDWDLQLNRSWWSKGIETRYGLDAETEELLLFWSTHIHPDDIERIKKALSQAFAKQEAVVVDEYRFRRADGSYAIVLDRGTVLYSDAGKPLRVVGAMMDITEQRRMEADKRDMMEKLHQIQKMEAIGTLASGIAHEFNNIMAIVQLANEQLRAKLRRIDLVQTTETIRKTVERGGTIARQLLDFSRSEQAEKKPFAFAPLIEELTGTLRRLLPKTIRITAITESNVWVEASDKQLYQVLLNLGINAGDAMPNGGTLTFTLSTETCRHPDNPFDELSSFAVVRVRDTGTGISPEVQRRMFEPFFTTKGIGKGTGLGLSIVHGIVLAHDGFIEVDSAVDEGTAFGVYMPLLPQSGNLTAAPKSIAAARGNETVMLVEDEPSLRKMLAQLLRRQGYTVLEAGDGVEALAVFEKHRKAIALVISDMGMPNMDGATLFKRLRRKRKRLNIIITTGYLDLADAEQFSKEEHLKVITKPFEIQTLLDAVQTLLA